MLLLEVLLRLFLLLISELSEFVKLTIESLELSKVVVVDIYVVVDIDAVEVEVVVVFSAIAVDVATTTVNNCLNRS